MGRSLVKVFIFCALAMFPDIAKAQYFSDIRNDGLLVKAPDEYQWNRWTTENFTVLALDVKSGEWLDQNLEAIKSIITMWGFPDFKFTKECRVMCTPNKDLLRKMFGISESQFKEKDGIIAAWISMDDGPQVLSSIIGRITFNEYEKVHNTKLGFWAKVGIFQLNSVQVKPNLSVLSNHVKNDKPMFFSKLLFSMTESDYERLDEEKKELYRAEAMVLCLFLRKEFGEVKLQGFMRIASKNGTEQSLAVVYGFKTLDRFDQSLKRYMRDLSNDYVAGKIPDSYLRVEPALK